MKKGDKVWVYRLQGGGKYIRFEAKIMAIDSGWAMLRRPRCVPLVEYVEDLEDWQNNPPGPLKGED